METRELDTGKEKEEAEASSQTVGPSPNCLSVFSCWVCSTPPSPFFFKQVVSYQVVAAVVPTPSCWTVKVASAAVRDSTPCTPTLLFNIIAHAF
ncbi:hypothetical protein LR48_Vigan11g136100 [Vigna angularis]|uniref:Uncharacterized protein n=1 Tax=Phaseolus angularis TaxID=3914 RepID=A0A0L9VTZ0_PHAAN|nr:hypothetical protein LR48_Vigan11g136100 [Vigna angularis]